MTKAVAKTTTAIAAPKQTGFMSVRGYENVSISEVPMPTIRLVQPGSKKIDLADGSKATPEHFYFDNLGISRSELHAAVITIFRRVGSRSTLMGRGLALALSSALHEASQPS